jgi:hypothetical protein
MARYKNGILGAFSGKVGTVVGASWCGTDYMRSLPEKSSKPETVAQRNQRYKMQLLRGFLLALNDLIKIGYQHPAPQKTPMNAALSYHLQNGVTDSPEDLKINFPDLLYSRGSLFVPWLPQVLPIAGQVLDFSWQSSAPAPLSKPNDQAALVVYNPIKKEFIILENAASRADGSAQLQLPLKYAGDTVHCYLNFMDANRKKASANVYIAEVNVI